LSFCTTAGLKPHPTKASSPDRLTASPGLSMFRGLIRLELDEIDYEGRQFSEDTQDPGPQLPGRPP
jgi:hypothetical protein